MTGQDPAERCKDISQGTRFLRTPGIETHQESFPGRGARSPRPPPKELLSGRANPLLSRGGVAAPSSKCREASFDGADGVVSVKKILFVVERTTPSAPNKVPSGHFC